MLSENYYTGIAQENGTNPTFTNISSFGMPIQGRTDKPDDYRYGFGGHEKEFDINSGWYSFGDYGYDARLGRRASLDPLTAEYPMQSAYLSFDNNPVFFNDPNAHNAVATISDNTITVTAVIYVINTEQNSLDINDAQAAVNNSWGKPFQYKDENGKTYNVKFDIEVKEATWSNAAGVFSENGNPVLVMPDSYHEGLSTVGNFALGKWIGSATEKTIAHEVGHLLGLADRYAKYEFIGWTVNGETPKDQPINYPGTVPNDLMGKGLGAVSQESIDAIASFALDNQQNGKTVINHSTLTKAGQPKGLNAPTNEEINQTDREAGAGWARKKEETK